jgi:hypothetical protein
MNTFSTLSRKLRLCGCFGVLWFSTLAGFGQTLVFTNAALVGGNFQFQILVASNTTFTIQTSTNLTDWEAVGTMTSVSNSITIMDPRGIAGFNRQYYRLSLNNSASYNIGFLEFADAGRFGGSLTPATSFPVTLNSYSATFEVSGDTGYPVATNVFFTGPGGSGLTNAPADPNNSNIGGDGGSHANYQSPIIFNPAIAPGGAWTVNYKGTNQTFSVPDPQAASRVVVPYPTATVSGGSLQSISWVYRDAATGAALGGPPAYMTHIQLQIHGSSQGGELYDSVNLTPATTSKVVTSSVTWTNVSGISMAYQDSLGNNYVISFAGPALGP